MAVVVLISGDETIVFLYHEHCFHNIVLDVYAKTHMKSSGLVLHPSIVMLKTRSDPYKCIPRRVSEQ